MEQGFDGRRAYAHLRALAQDIGPRPGGSEDERKAAEYIAGVFDDAGLSVRTETFPVDLHRQVRTELHAITDEGSYRINCAAQLFAANTPPEGVEGDLVFVETAHPQYLEDRFRDKVWLILGGLPLSHYGRALSMKPRAVVAVENQMGVLPKRTHLRQAYRERYGSVPTVRISYEDGMRLLRERVRRVRVVSQGEESRSESVNVVGELPGRDPEADIVLVCAHLDSVRHVAGAGDNASGTSIMMELARVFAGRGSRRTLRFVGFGSEELGLLGSLHYARALWNQDRTLRGREGFNEVFDRTELVRHRLCINLDMHGVTLGSNVSACMGPPDLATAVRLLSSEIGPAFSSISERTFSSDGMSLAAVGVPGVAFARVGGSSVVTHSRADTLEYLDADHLAMLGGFVEVFLTRYAADAFVFPFERTLPPALRSDVETYFKTLNAEDFPPKAPRPA